MSTSWAPKFSVVRSVTGHLTNLTARPQSADRLLPGEREQIQVDDSTLGDGEKNKHGKRTLSAFFLFKKGGSISLLFTSRLSERKNEKEANRTSGNSRRGVSPMREASVCFWGAPKSSACVSSLQFNNKVPNRRKETSLHWDVSTRGASAIHFCSILMNAKGQWPFFH